MAESERRRLITSTPHLAPEEVVQRTFATSFRGYAEAEVRAFLKRVSEELAVMRDRQAELLDAIDALEEQLRAPRPLSEPELLDALGAETTRVLRSARDTADELRIKGEERAAELAEQARAAAESVRLEAEELLRSRTAEAEALVADVIGEAEERAAEIRSAMEIASEEQRLRAEREVDELIEAARQQGREMLDEAKATRERVLADLLRRRGLLQAQVEELRSGRDNLLDAYRVVKRTFLDATEALAQVEARAAAERAAPSSEHPTETGDDTDEGVALGGEALVPADTEGAAGSAVGAGDATDPSLADVDSLFARIRAGQVEAAIEPDAPAPVADAGAGPAVEPAEDASGAEAEPPERTVDLTRAEETASPEAGAPLSAVDAWRTRRAEVVDPLLGRVAKRAKRTAQDDQNALLDAVRRHKGRPTADQVLAPEPELLEAWSAVIREAVDDAYGAGREAAAGERLPADDELAAEAAAAIVLPLRERLSAAFEAGDDGDPGGLVERIGARFREWKNQSLENTLADVLAMAWSRGVYDAAPSGAVLQWIPLVEGRCADCDDNGLEPTVKGSSFPTGQLHPPAHPGCRCLLAPSDVLSGLAASA